MMEVIIINLMIWKPIRSLCPDPLQHVLLSFSDIIVTMGTIIDVSWVFVVWIVLLVGFILIRMQFSAILDL
jgi:hypothetical protein